MKVSTLARSHYLTVKNPESTIMENSYLQSADLPLPFKKEAGPCPAAISVILND